MDKTPSEIKERHDFLVVRVEQLERERNNLAQKLKEVEAVNERWKAVVKVLLENDGFIDFNNDIKQAGHSGDLYNLERALGIEDKP